jgi:hypothetical protein
VGWLAWPCQVITQTGGRGFETVEPINVLQEANEPIEGCHVAAQEWATWHLPTHPNHATCRHTIFPHLPQCHCHVRAMCSTDCMDLPHHLYGHATCHHCKGDMCHSLTPPPICPHHHQLYPATSAVHMYGMYMQLPRGTVRTV